MQLSLSRSLANLTRVTQVTVNTVSPGSVKTEGVITMLEKMYPSVTSQEAEVEYMRKNRPTSLIERLIRPEEIADTVTFLCSAKASSVNGAVFRG
jgi:3-oxoacyl-[acyl-carrier protein] reductase